VKSKGAQVVAISTDDVATLKRFKTELKLPYPLLSDDGGKVAAKYAGLMPVVHVAKRANFVVAKDGIVKEVVSGNDAIDPSASVNACGG
jgi:thioredoxin-dependent peroxiredoxin